MHRNEGFRDRGGFAPVHVGEEVDVKIEAVGEKGDGIAKVKGFVLFVPNTKQGDEVKVKVTRVLRKVGFAEVVGTSSGDHKHEKHEESQEEETEEESTDEASEDTEDSEDEEFTEDSEDSEEFGEE